jgi:hypothetical protein
VIDACLDDESFGVQVIHQGDEMATFTRKGSEHGGFESPIFMTSLFKGGSKHWSCEEINAKQSYNELVSTRDVKEFVSTKEI